MASLPMEAIKFRQPSKYYALLLKEQWLQFQIKALAYYGSLPFQDYKQFIECFKQDSVEYKEKVVELYMHNFILIYMNLQDPNTRLGDMQIMALAYQSTHEESRAEEVEKVMTK